MSMKAKHSRALAFSLCAVLLAAVCLAAGIFGMRWLDQNRSPNVAYELEDAADIVQRLYAQKHPYIGRNPHNLVELLTFPGDWNYYGSQQHTLQEPYGYQRFFYTDEASYKEFIYDPARQALLQKNALILMALVDNCGFVQWTLKWSDGQVDYNNYPSNTELGDMGSGGATFTYTRQWAEQAVGGDLAQCAESEESFRDFLLLLDTLKADFVEPDVQN